MSGQLWLLHLDLLQQHLILFLGTLTTFRVHVTLEIAVDIGGIATELAAEVTGWLATLVLQVTLETVLPFVVAIAVATHPGLFDIGIVDHVLGVFQGLFAGSLILGDHAVAAIIGNCRFEFGR